MKKLLLLIASLSFFHLAAMEQNKNQFHTTPMHVIAEKGNLNELLVLLKEGANPNVQDENGDTPAHKAAAVCATIHNELATKTQLRDELRSEYELKQKQIDSIPVRETLIREQKIITRKISALEATCAPNQELLNKLRGIHSLKQEEIASCTVQDITSLVDERQIIKSKIEKNERELRNLLGVFGKYRNIIRRLIEHGVHLHIPNKSGIIIEQLVPSLIFATCRTAIFNNNTESLDKLLSAGANPNSCVPVPLLLLATAYDRQVCARLLLYYGATFTTSQEPDSVNILHRCARQRQNGMISTLLVCPQGSPKNSYYAHKDIQDMQNRIYTFLGCLKKREEDGMSTIPLELIQKIYAFMLPKTDTLINLISLQKLRTYIKFVGKDTLIEALERRHISIVNHALNSPDANGHTPTLMARIPQDLQWIDQIDQLDEPNETSKLLDPAENPLESRKETIKAKYARLLE